MDRPDWAPEGIDLTRPSVARAYDYWLGGSHNFAIDRDWARQVLAAVPDLRLMAQANRAFLHRAVRFMVDQGVRQFLDIGSGIPTVGNVHEIAQRAAPGSRVVYVDIDPVAVAHSEQILKGEPGAAVIMADLRQPSAVLTHRATRALLDFDRPVGLLLCSVLHAIPDADDPYGMVRELVKPLPPGSYVAISHGTLDDLVEEADEMTELAGRTTTPITGRPRAEVERFFAGLELVEPGLVWSVLWRPEEPDETFERPGRSGFYAGVARVPG
ncbi:SAM-dependent methyltransferase [Rhizomonospora bruguierae]|uniref:SAM-dependent methyltransferase n=1 Tax=Rhizomonospora bruguierae TaxID=1581705 RepID=UPI001BCD800A|nr:SAM-dependent methyltransferase [Micromonospora sp. NBRC 107566]